MSTLATRIRTAIVERLTGRSWLPIDGEIRTQPLPQFQDDDLPGLRVLILSESFNSDGDANHGVPRFETEITIGISRVRGFALPADLDADMDAEVDRIEAALLSDPDFLDLFEAVTRMSRTRLFPQDGETYYAELRLEMSFLARVAYEPVIPDDYHETRLTVRLAGAGPDTPTRTVVLDSTTP